MLVEQVEGKWIEAFAETFRLCGVTEGETAAVLSESQSRPVNVRLADLALQRLGARVFHVVLTTPPQKVAVPVRSTGASDAIGGLEPAVAALAGSSFVADCTVEGLLHAPELGAVLDGGARILMVSNEHPEILERLVPDPALASRVQQGAAMLEQAAEMRVTSDGGHRLDHRRVAGPVRRKLGMHRRSGNHRPLARRAVPVLPRSRQRSTERWCSTSAT